LLDVNDNPVSGATVTVRELTTKQQGNRHSVSTDQYGHFAIKKVDVGNYMVVAAKNNTAMRNPHAFAAPDTAFTVVSIGSDLPEARIILRLGNKTGVLTGHIRDAVTGTPLIAKVEIKLIGSGKYWMAAGVPPEYSIPVPSDTEMSVEISAVGYQTWRSSTLSDQRASTVLTVHRGEKKKVEVSLQPLSGN
jgi:predicted phage gp36 major capsid-like protein